MSVKGKIYAKYLKKAKYVVKGKRLKTPIATIQKRVVPIAPPVEVHASVPKSVPVQENGLQMKKVNSSDFDKGANRRNNNSDEKEISFVELGKKIVDGDGEENDKKGDSKTLFIVTAALAVIIIAAMVKVGSMVYTEISPEKKVASEEAKELDKDDELSDFLLGNNGEEIQATEDEMEDILEDVLAAEGTDINSVSKEEKQTRLKQIENAIVNTQNQANSNATSRQEYLDYIKEELKGTPPTDSGITDGDKTNPTQEPTKPTEPTKPSKPSDGDDDNGELPSNPGNGPGTPAAGDDDKKDYVKLGSSDKAFVLYRVTKQSVKHSAITSNPFSKYKADDGDIKVSKDDSYGIWFIDDGSGVKILTGYSSGKVSVYKVTLKEKVNEQYETEATYYVLAGGKLSLESNYLEENEQGEGKKEFVINSDTTLYKK